MKKNYPDQDLFEFSHQVFLEKLIKIQSSNRTFQGKSDDVDPVGMRGCPPLHILQNKKDTLGKSTVMGNTLGKSTLTASSHTVCSQNS